MIVSRLMTKLAFTPALSLSLVGFGSGLDSMIFTTGFACAAVASLQHAAFVIHDSKKKKTIHDFVLSRLSFLDLTRDS